MKQVDFDELFRELNAGGFDGTLTTCVFACEEGASESSVFRKIDGYTAAWSWTGCGRPDQLIMTESQVLAP
ncbi:hypothetical protein AB0D57_42870 [Streptomyces sp. NPDC048275]|uniref:hypothetical protein n=1 Tax=Streptomyces sp. NPDC048275 TaxID=3155629 RepID=UPI0033F0EEEE